MSNPIGFEQFRTLTLNIYRPPIRAVATFRKMRRALDTLAELPQVKSTSDLTTQTIAAWLAGPRLDRNINSTISLLIARSAPHATMRSKKGGSIGLRRSPASGPGASRRRRNAITRGPRSRPPDRPEGQGRRRLEAPSALCRGLVRGPYRSQARRGPVRQGRGYRPASKDLLAHARTRLKTEDSAAPIPLARDLVDVLRVWLPKAGNEWLFPGATKKGPWHGGAHGYRPTDRLRKAGEAVGIKGLDFHSLRHTLGKLLWSEFGRTAEQARILLRHTDVRTTEEHYLHPNDLEALHGIVEGVSFREPPKEEQRKAG